MQISLIFLCGHVMSERKESASQYHVLAQSKECKILTERKGGF